MNPGHLIIFTRYPEAGKVKTRLIPAIGAPAAAALQREMTEALLSEAKKLSGIEIEVRFAGGSKELMRSWLGENVLYTPQAKGNLGRRMQEAFHSHFQKSTQPAVLVGTDIPDLNSTRLAQAFQELKNKDLVIGPTFDGGYYLIGMATSHEELFHTISWGSQSVLQDTLKIAATNGLHTTQLETLRDIDTADDLALWQVSRRYNQKLCTR